jgi:hypothetical protein
LILENPKHENLEDSTVSLQLEEYEMES